MIHEVIQQQGKGLMEAFNTNYPELFLKDLAEDIILTSPHGKFQGKEEVDFCIGWLMNRVREIRVELTGIGIIAEGHKAVCEYDFSGITYGKPVSYHNFIAIELSENERIREIRILFDRLDVALQTADEKTLETNRSLVHDMDSGLQIEPSETK